jgi:hypothetical protein
MHTKHVSLDIEGVISCLVPTLELQERVYFIGRSIWMNDGDVSGTIPIDIFTRTLQETCVYSLNLVVKLDFNMTHVLVPIFCCDPFVNFDDASMIEYIRFQRISILC